jgi:integrase
MRSLVIVALRTGLRWGEIVHLKWHQAPESNYVDFEREIIFIHESLTKSGKSRWIPLGQIVKWELLNVPKQKDTDYIFLNAKTKKPLGSTKDAFNRAVRKAGIDFTFHSLRHTFASQLVRNGVDLYVVQKLLGHASAKMTQRYVHLREDMLTDAIKKIDRQFESVLYNNALENSTVLARRHFQGNEQLKDSSLSLVTPKI